MKPKYARVLTPLDIKRFPSAHSPPLRTKLGKFKPYRIRDTGGVEHPRPVGAKAL